MNKIATHNSATGEKCKNLLSWLLIPFARTQTKTISEQFAAGCRMFDIRAKESGDNWYCAHGPFKTKRTVEDILTEINSLGVVDGGDVYVSLTYEGTGTNNEAFLKEVGKWKSKLTHIIWGDVAVKYGDGSSLTKVKYTVLILADAGYKGGTQGFLPLDGSTWHTYLPIPWLWDRVYKRPHNFNEQTFTYVDFL